jgi:hypothetical protein
MRYRARWTTPDGTQHSRSFPNGHRKDAYRWLRSMVTTPDNETTTARQQPPPKAFRITFRQP